MIFSTSSLGTYIGAYEGNLERLRRLSTDEIEGEYREHSFKEGISETFSYWFNPARRGHVDAILSARNERGSSARNTGQ